MKPLPYGYRLEKDGGSVTIDAITAAVLHSIFRDALAGASIASISARLNDVGAPTPHRFREVRGC